MPFKPCPARLVTLVFMCGGLAFTPQAHATLAGDAASITANAHTLSATHQVQKLAEGERHELVLASGVIVHQYLSPGGTVYAITWQGRRPPDLRELLGPGFSQLSHRAPGGHHRMDFTGVDLKVQSMGHRHSSSGRAWVPSLVPAGVTVDASLE
jgi:hypothetical protein